MRYRYFFTINSLLLITSFFISGCSGSDSLTKKHSNNSINLDTVQAQKFDNGKMWTFEYAPLDYFKETYNFKPDEQWLNKVRMSALRFASYCSASFVSADGLVMTNDHCGRGSVTKVTGEGEDLQGTGFFAERLEDERKVDGLYVDQLVLIKDVTADVQAAINAASTEEEKLKNKTAKIDELKEKYKKETGLITDVTSLYNGGKYSLYGYKRYNDVRLVFAPETQAGFFGGDYDNFTYPRYNLDVTFFRVYDDNGQPLKTDNYFKWSSNGAADGEAVFVVGNPGRTSRLKTYSQLEYYRDITYPDLQMQLGSLIDVYQTTMDKHPERKNKMMDRFYGLTNSMKVYNGVVKGLNDPFLMARKRDFESKFRMAVEQNPKLSSEFGGLWDKIADIRTEMRKFASEVSGYNLKTYLASDYFEIAKDLITYANEMKMPEQHRLPEYQAAMLDSTVKSIFPAEFDKEYNDLLLAEHADYLISKLGKDHELVQKLFGGKSGKEAAQYALQNSKLTSKEAVDNFLKNTPEQILSSDDPFIYFIVNSADKLKSLRSELTELTNSEEVINQKLGRALFEVYGTSIPPDATFTLRISDGFVKGYEYNGTLAPSKVTFYGLYDRYYSFKGQYPWNLPERWQNPPAEFDLETPYNFISTNDIIGGNSGSPVINKNAEVVGIAFDGNIESLPGNFIYTTESNRCVNVASEGMMECIQDLYKAERLSEELKNGKVPPQFQITTTEAEPKGN